MAKKKKPSHGGDTGFKILVTTFQFAFAWAGRTMDNIFKSLKWLFQNRAQATVANTNFDSWCTTNFGGVVRPIIKALVLISLLFLLGQYIISIFLIWMILKSF
jgi:mannose/fructose/N-acetylgalactosamine-specific phosphotransferase system component IIC